MPNLKLELPEYLEQDGSSCSYDDQSAVDSMTNKSGADDNSANASDPDQKLDIGPPYYSNQNTDNLDKHQSTDLGTLNNVEPPIN